MRGTARQNIEQQLLPALRRESLSVRVAQILKRYILAERIESGDRLPSERRLADWLNVSRTVLREALNQLIGEGILYRPSAHALCVADFDRSNLASELVSLIEQDAEVRDLIELRVIIEIGAVEAIIERLTTGHLREIERWVVEGERRVAAGEPIYRADAHFHAALIQVLGNRAINGSLLPLIEENLRQNLVVDPLQLMGMKPTAAHQVVEQHRQIFEAVKERDTDAARRLMRAHLSPYLHREQPFLVTTQPGDNGRSISDGGNRS